MIESDTCVVYGLRCSCGDCNISGVGFRYVGQTRKSVKERMWQHRANAGKPANHRIGRLPVYRWMRKHGPENIQMIVLEDGLSVDMVDDREKHWIRRLNTFAPGGYNMTEGGLGKSGYRHSAETKAQISSKRRGVPGHSRSGLTEPQVREIKVRLWNGETQAELADEYGVTRKTLKDISQDKVKTHIPWPIGPRQKPRTSELRSRKMLLRQRDDLGRMLPGVPVN